MSKERIEIYIDQEKFTINYEKQTAAELLILAKEDPAETTLVQKIGKEIVKFKDDEVINLKNGMQFVVFHDSPTSVSNFGPDRFIEELTVLGYQPELIVASDRNKYAILREFEIPLGKFTGRTIDLGILATNDFLNVGHFRTACSRQTPVVRKI